MGFLPDLAQDIIRMLEVLLAFLIESGNTERAGDGPADDTRNPFTRRFNETEPAARNRRAGADDDRQ